MTSLTLTSVQTHLVLTPEAGAALTLTAQVGPQLVFAAEGVQGPPGPPPSPGPGFILVGDELRLAISTLPQG